MRDAFAVLFFVSVGMLFDPGSLMAYPGLTVGALGVVLVGKPLVAFVLVWTMKYQFRAALTVGVALAQIGEFSFMLATVGRDLGVLTTDATNALVATSITSIVLNPIAYRTIRPLERSLKARPRLWAILNREQIPSDLSGAVPQPTADAGHRAVVIGYGPTGRTVVRLLRDNDIVPTVIELNIAAVRALKDEGVDAIYGDATRRETMEAAGVAHASTLILSSAGMTDSDEVIRMARGLNPDIRVLARAPYLRDLPVLKAAGADRVYSAEGEVALALIEDILDTLGATSEQIDRERARAHSELLGEG